MHSFSRADRLSEYDYPLPEELIAQRPAARRDASRLLVLEREGGGLREARFADLPGLLDPTDLLVVNRSRVIPARLIGKKADTGGAVEILLHREEAPGLWLGLVRPSGRVRPGVRVELDGGTPVEVGAAREDGQREIRFPAGVQVEEVLERSGHVPLPPYVRRPDEPEDRERYQTVYAREPGSVAAPTAGLHFTPELLAALRARGIGIAEVVLHVGLGTFQPLRHDSIPGNRLETERYRVPAETRRALADARREGRRVVAVGTTTVRALEAAGARPDAGAVEGDLEGSTDLFIHPPHRFRVVDALVTNFHLPRSSLLLLVAAFAGRERILEAYRYAVARRFRFYSYGDAMLIV
jgi:S-adenosylmethionine:tRNA ribosyltransferase-isomerase